MMQPSKMFTFFLASSFVSFSGHALVDYSQSESYTPKNSGARSVKAAPASAPRAAKVQRSVSRSASSGQSGKTHFSSELSYGSQNIKLQDVEAKTNVMRFNGHFATDYNIFLDASYFQTSSSSTDLIGDATADQEKGNPELKLGFNWLNIGQAAEAVTVDLYGGYSFGQNNSIFATSRDDRIVGVSTAKRFHHFVIGLGYELRMTGDAIESERQVGNITALEANLGWVVSNDIRFLLNAKSYQVSAGDRALGLNLDRTLKFSTITPKMILSLAPMINLNLAAQFRTRRLKDNDTLDANLWSLDAAYGTSLIAGLSFTL
jgi:hypothetical protein